MIENEPSATARRVAALRAVHQMIDSPVIFEDPFAAKIIGENALAYVQAKLHWYKRSLGVRAIRAFLVARSRFAEEELKEAVDNGVSQYVVLGAGMDTFAYRNPFPKDKLRVFEVDFPATQKWKRMKLAESRIAIPDSVTFAPVDFEKETLAEGLKKAGFDFNRPAFFSWLGVTMYLTEETIMSTFGFIASLPKGSGVAFDYVILPSMANLLNRLVFYYLSRRLMRSGEPWITFFDPAVLINKMKELGFNQVEDISAKKINEMYFTNRNDKLKVGGLGRLMKAFV